MPSKKAGASGAPLALFYLEDDPTLAGAVREHLAPRGFLVQVFGTVCAAKTALLASLPAALLLDWNLPDGTGNEFLCWLRARWPKLPVLFLTVRGDAADIVAGLEGGADDYLTKPFLLEVLCSRIRAVLRRAEGGEGQLFCDAIRLDREKAAVWLNGQPVALAPAEYRLLLLLLENKGRTLPRARLLEQLWDAQGSFVNDNTLTVTVKRLREKLGGPPCLKTVRSFGYRMEDTV